MPYLKLTILSITVCIGLIHGPVHVSCRILPPPTLDRRSDETRTVLFVQDNSLQNVGGFGNAFGRGFQSNLALLLIPALCEYCSH